MVALVVIPYAEEATPTDTDSIVEDNTSISTEKYDEKKGIVNIRLMFWY